MSIQVAIEDLAEEVARRGAGYLLTATAGSRPHVMHLRLSVDGAELRGGIGRSASRNIAVQPAVTLLWPPDEEGGLSLIVDGIATLDGDGVVVVTASSAVLHRPA
jgi:hypothetical protein